MAAPTTIHSSSPLPHHPHHHQQQQRQYPMYYQSTYAHPPQQHYPPSSSSSSPPQQMDGGNTLSAAKIKSSAAKRANAKAAAATKKAQQQAAQAQAQPSASNSNHSQSSPDYDQHHQDHDEEHDDDDDDELADDQEIDMTASVNKGKSKTGNNRAGRASSVATTSQAGSPTPSGADWVVPQRAKPGRKPSQEEPLTKRQAQNRASQRAFRERKQSHVATLEAKVAAFEAQNLTRAAREKENNRKITQENETLKSRNASLTEENASLKSRIQALETTIQQMKLTEQRTSSSGTASSMPSTSNGGWTPCYEAGCRAPAHEQQQFTPLQQRKKRPLPSRAYEQVTQPAQHLSPQSQHAPTYNTTSRFGAMTIANVSSSPPTDLAPSLPLQSRTPFETSLAPFDDSSPNDSSISFLPNRHASSPDLMPANSDIDMVDRDCGFCTDATPCLCRGDAILDLTGMMDDDQENGSEAVGMTSGVDRMIKIEEEDEGEEAVQQTNNITAASATTSAPAAAISISSLLSSRPKSSAKPKLWTTVDASKPVESIASSKPTSAAAAAANGKKNKLWWTRPATAQTYWTPSVMSFVAPGEKQLNEQLYVDDQLVSPSSTSTAAWQRRNSLLAAGASQAEIEAALCSGDPSNCPACATDPALAAFCEAVGEGEGEGRGEESHKNGPAVNLSAPPRPTTSRPALYQANSAIPTSKFTTTSSSNGNGTSNGSGFTIPLSTAYRPRSTSANALPTLRSLDLSLTSPTSPTQLRNRAAGYSIPDAFRQIRSHPSFPQWQGGLNLLADVVSGRNTSPVSKIKDESTTSSKRRRIYLENDKVQEALRMLDSPGSSRSTSYARSSALPIGSKFAYTAGQSDIRSTAEQTTSNGAPCMECPCPCPWAQGEDQKEGEEGVDDVEE
ncbi:unnamed protein product [Sympodiomycopsis kandeliae]